MKKFILWLATSNSVKQTPWEGQAETIHEAIRLAEAENPGMIVTQGSSL